MSYKKVKSSSKLFVSNREKLEKVVVNTMKKISDIVGGTLGPSGRVVIIESEMDGIPNTITKDGVTVFESLGAENSFEHLIIETARGSARKSATEAGDGTTTTTILAAALTEKIFNFTYSDRKFSPQKVVRIINKLLNEELLPYVKAKSIPVTVDNQDLLHKVATISANGDVAMADTVIKAFEETGMTANSHVTISELTGPESYKVRLIEGFPIPMGYEESVGKFHTAFINDQANLRCILEKPLFILFDGQVSDIINFQETLEKIGSEYANGNSDYKNVVIVAHGFSESVLTTLAFCFANPQTINIVPLATPMNQVINSRLNFLLDLSAFTGAKVFGMTQPLRDAQPEDFGRSMEKMEIYRFKSTLVGNPDPMDIETRVEILQKQSEDPESAAAAYDLKERIGKLTSGIAKLEIYAGSGGELKEKHDRCEDAVCAVRSTINNGALPGGCRILTDLALKMAYYNKGSEQENKVANTILAEALLTPVEKLLDNAGYNAEEIKEIIKELINKPSSVYDVERQIFGDPETLGIFDATPAVEQSLINSISIAGVMGTLGGAVAFPRDSQLERDEAQKEMAYRDAVNNPTSFRNEANERS
jgi:chaperonin GroEL